jgi:DNA-binding transcriptional LysR family regulator
MASSFPIPLNALRAIEIVARRGALAPAAEELGVTPGAVSQHLRRAEERLGVLLFDRTPQGLRPTPVLRAILPRLTGGFETLQGALAALRPEQDSGILTITVASVFASRWLVWRVGKFTALHPDIEVRMVVSPTLVDLRHSDIDAAIRYGRGQWPGVKAELIGGALYRPVCAPELAKAIRTPADLARVPVIHETTSMLSWADWFAAAGLPEAPQLTGPTITDSALAFDAAIAGQGVLLAVDMMSADPVSDGRLVRPFPMAVKSGLGYWLAVADNRRESRKVKLLRDWLRVEVPDSARGYVEQTRRGTR